MLDSGRTRDWRAALVNALRLLELVQLVGLEANQRRASAGLLGALQMEAAGAGRGPAPILR